MKTVSEIRNQVLQGDCLEILRQFPSSIFSSVICDPPYALDNKPADIRKVLKGWLNGEDVKVNENDFMGKDWQLPGPKIWEEVMRVLKPGGHILSFSGTRTYDLMVTAIRIAGAEIRDKFAYVCDAEPDLSWAYGCLSEDTELLINGEWRSYTDARIGSMTLCHDIVTGEFRNMPIQEVPVYDYNDTAYTIRSALAAQIVSRNHRCVVEGADGKPQFQLAEKLADRKQEIRVPIMSPDMRTCTTTLARIEPFNYVGKVWCIRVPTGAFVARRNGKVFITGNSGFPKSMNIAKVVEKKIIEAIEAQGIEFTEWE